MWSGLYEIEVEDSAGGADKGTTEDSSNDTGLGLEVDETQDNSAQGFEVMHCLL